MRVQPFERVFRGDDARLFHRMTRELVGKKLSRWRETYADGLVLDFGELIPKRYPKPSLPQKDRGEWVVATWGCDVVLYPTSGPALDSAQGGIEPMNEYLDQLVGQRVRAVRIDSSDLSLEIEFSDGTRVVLRADQETTDLDQWFILTSFDMSIGVSAAGTWYLRPTVSA